MGNIEERITELVKEHGAEQVFDAFKGTLEKPNVKNVDEWAFWWTTFNEYGIGKYPYDSGFVDLPRKDDDVTFSYVITHKPTGFACRIDGQYDSYGDYETDLKWKIAKPITKTVTEYE